MRSLDEVEILLFLINDKKDLELLESHNGARYQFGNSIRLLISDNIIYQLGICFRTIPIVQHHIERWYWCFVFFIKNV